MGEPISGANYLIAAHWSRQRQCTCPARVRAVLRRWGVVALLAVAQLLVVVVGGTALPGRYDDRPSASSRGLFPPAFTEEYGGGDYTLWRAAANRGSDRDFVLRFGPSPRARLTLISCEVGDYRLRIGSGVIEGPCRGLQSVEGSFTSQPSETWHVEVLQPQPHSWGFAVYLAPAGAR